MEISGDEQGICKQKNMKVAGQQPRAYRKDYRHPGPLRSELKVSKACLAPKAPRKERSARLLESADLRLSIGYEAKQFDKDRQAKVRKALGLATDLPNTSVRSASSVLPKARLTLRSPPY